MRRDLCLTVGLHITCRNYDLEENISTQVDANIKKEEIDSIKLPFQFTDIVDIDPLVKHLDIVSDDVQANMEIVIKLNF